MENFEIFRDIAANKQRSDIRKRLEALEEQGKGVAECPHCAGLLPKIGVSKCRHCGSDLVWHGEGVAKAGELEVAKRMDSEIQLARQRSKEEAARLKEKEALANARAIKWVGGGLVVFVIAVGSCVQASKYAEHRRELAQRQVEARVAREEYEKQQKEKARLRALQAEKAEIQRLTSDFYDASRPTKEQALAWQKWVKAKNRGWDNTSQWPTGKFSFSYLDSEVAEIIVDTPAGEFGGHTLIFVKPIQLHDERTAEMLTRNEGTIIFRCYPNFPEAYRSIFESVFEAQDWSTPPSYVWERRNKKGR